MGCRHSKHSRVKHNGQLYNEDVDIREKFLTGVHIAKGANGIEGNIQIALGTTRQKKYELVTPAMTEEPAKVLAELEEPAELAVPEEPAEVIAELEEPAELAVPEEPAEVIAELEEPAELAVPEEPAEEPAEVLAEPEN